MAAARMTSNGSLPGWPIKLTPSGNSLANTVGTVTALVPVLGYDKASELAREAYKSGKGLIQLAREKRLLTEAQIKNLLDPDKLTNLDRIKYPRTTQRSARRGNAP